MEIKFIHTADLHLGKKFLSLESQEISEKLNEHMLKSFSKICEVATEKDVDLLLIAGDLFDYYNPIKKIVKRVNEGFKKLKGRDIKVIICPGTHDGYFYKDSIYRNNQFEDNVFIIKESKFSTPKEIGTKSGKVLIYSVALDPTISKPYLEKIKRISIPGIHLGIFHGTLLDGIPWEVKKRYFPIKKEELISMDMDYIALGHTHNFKEIRDNNRLIAAYSGSPFHLNFSDKLEKGIFLVTLENGESRLQKIKISDILWEEKEIDCTKLTNNEIKSEIEKLEDKNLILNLSLVGQPSEFIKTDEILESLRNLFFNLLIIDETISMKMPLKDISEEKSLRGLMTKKVLEKIEISSSDYEKEKWSRVLFFILKSLQKEELPYVD